DYAMTGFPEPLLSDSAAMPAEAIHGTAGEPFQVPSKAKNGAGGLEFLRVMLSKEQAQNFAKVTSSATVVKDSVPDDAFGSTALASVNEMIKSAGDNVFTWNFTDWYGLGPDFKPLWNEFLTGDISADEALERSQKVIDTVREDDNIEKFDVEGWALFLRLGVIRSPPPRPWAGAAGGGPLPPACCSSRCSSACRCWSTSSSSSRPSCRRSTT